MKTHPMGVELFHVDGQTDVQAGRRTNITKIRVAFRNFSKSNDKGNCIYDVTIHKKKQVVVKYLSTILTRHIHLRNIKKKSNIASPRTHPMCITKNRVTTLEIITVYRKILRNI
jgi:hypothetical protein